MGALCQAMCINKKIGVRPHGRYRRGVISPMAVALSNEDLNLFGQGSLGTSLYAARRHGVDKKAEFSVSLAQFSR